MIDLNYRRKAIDSMLRSDSPFRFDKGDDKYDK